MNGYTQIQIGGKLRGFKWGKWASEKYVMLKTKGIKSDAIFLTDDFNAIMYAGLLMNCYVKQVDPDFTFEELVEWMEVIAPEELVKMNDAMASSHFFQDHVNKKKEQENLTSKSGKSTLKKKESLLTES